MLKRYRNGLVPARHDELAPDAERVTRDAIAALHENRLQDALMDIWKLVARANKYVDDTAPFKLARDVGQAARLDEVLYNLAETCRVLGVLLLPFLPATAEKIFAQLRLDPAPTRLDQTRWGGLAAGHPIGDPMPLFPRRDMPVAK
jgi:methionyl-tRNA synthetase